jgi:hypothetical protein
MLKVICKNPSGYPNLTEGKEYQVKELCPQLITPNFTFPRYVSVIDDRGKTSTGHAYRFETLEGQCCNEYIKEHIKDERGE